MMYGGCLYKLTATNKQIFVVNSINKIWYKYALAFCKKKLYGKKGFSLSGGSKTKDFTFHSVSGT